MDAIVALELSGGSLFDGSGLLRLPIALLISPAGGSILAGVCIAALLNRHGHRTWALVIALALQLLLVGYFVLALRFSVSDLWLYVNAAMLLVQIVAAGALGVLLFGSRSRNTPAAPLLP